MKNEDNVKEEKEKKNNSEENVEVNEKSVEEKEGKVESKSKESEKEGSGKEVGGEKSGESKVEEKESEKEGSGKVKEEAIVRGKDLHISTKHAVAICKFIKGKTIEEAINYLEEVIKGNKAIPMKGEIPHRKGIERGRYPKKASEVIIKLLKNLNSNCNFLGISNPYISLAKADKASRPYRRFGTTRFKRTHVIIIAKGKE